MKNFIYTLSILVLFSCNSKNSTSHTSDTIKLSGLITNMAGQYLFLISKDESKTIVDSIEIDSTGYFEFTKKLDKPQYFTIEHGKESQNIYLTPGDDLSFNVDISNFDETLNFAGKGERANNYLINHKLKSKNYEYIYPNQILFLKNEAEFTKLMDSIKFDMIKDYDGLKNVDGISEEFLHNEKASIIYAWVNKHLIYESYHSYLIEDENFKVSDNFYKFLDNITIDDSTLRNNGEYKNFVNWYIDYKADELIKNDPELEKNPIGYLLSRFKTLEENIHQPSFIEEYKYNMLLQFLESDGTRNVEELYQEFITTVKNEEYKTELESAYKLWDHLKPGSESPDFTFTDIKGKEVSLSDFKGKYVYIDFWATWCGPCLNEIPYLEKIHHEFKDKNIVFISVSVDREKKRWEDMVKTKNMVGIQLHEGDDETFSSFYMIKYIPRFILIDKEGKIIYASAPKPSENIADEILKLEGI